ncbi:MAG: hypothetical protein IJC52_02595 [Clostridia bacterium]|nr:hypothetical protein [Clostridia bacterium]
MSTKQSYEKQGAATPLMALKIFGYSVLAGVMALFLSLSISMISTGALTHTVGYHEYEVIDGEQVLINTVMFDENTDYESQMTTADDDRRISREMITEPKNAACAALIVCLDVVEQVLMILVLVVLTGYYVYREGDRDRNLIKHHGRPHTPLRGLWIGLIAAVPYLLLYASLVLAKCGVVTLDTVQGVYRLLNACFTPLINLIMPLEVYPATAVSVAQLLALFGLQLVLPLTCAVAYTLGDKRLIKKWKKRLKAQG